MSADVFRIEYPQLSNEIHGKGVLYADSNSRCRKMALQDGSNSMDEGRLVYQLLGFVPGSSNMSQLPDPIRPWVIHVI